MKTIQVEHKNLLGIMYSLVNRGVLLEGDCGLVCGKVEALRWFISRAQTRMLADFIKDKEEEEINEKCIKKCAQYTHTLMVVNNNIWGDMYRPVPRAMSWVNLKRVIKCFSGDILLLVLKVEKR